jgi:tetratricopeptide (TPR) repeat protein
MLRGAHGGRPGFRNKSMLSLVRRLSSLVLVTATLWACAPPPEPAAEADAGPAPSEPGLAAFLAGRFAQAHGDTRQAAEYLLIAAGRDPDNLDLQQRAFTLLMAEGRLDEAAPMAGRLLAIDEGSALPALLVGTRAARDGDFANAYNAYGSLPRKGLNSFLTPLLLAWTEAGRGRWDEALALLTVTNETKAFAPIYEFHAGLVAELAGRVDLAEARYKSAIAAQTSVRTVQAVGAFYQRHGRMDAARELYKRYFSEHADRSLLDGDRQLSLGPGIAPVVANPTQGLAEAMFDTASLVRQSAAHDLVLVFSRLALALRPDFPLAQIVVADTLGQQTRLAEANEIYRKVAGDPQVEAFARLRLAVNLDQLGDTDGSVRELEALTKARPDSADPQATLGDILRRHKRFAEAAVAYDQALTRAGGSANPHNWALFYARGIAYERSRQWPKAERDLEEALRLRPEQADVLNYLGYSWVDQGINLDKGRQMIERAVKLRPNDGAIVDSLGWALYRMGDFQGAVRYLERAAELKAEDPTINEHLGDAMWRVGRYDEARFQWQRAMSLEPEPEQVEGLKIKTSTGRMPEQK